PKYVTKERPQRLPPRAPTSPSRSTASKPRTSSASRTPKDQWRCNLVRAWSSSSRSLSSHCNCERELLARFPLPLRKGRRVRTYFVIGGGKFNFKALAPSSDGSPCACRATRQLLSLGGSAATSFAGDIFCA